MQQFGQIVLIFYRSNRELGIILNFQSGCGLGLGLGKGEQVSEKVLMSIIAGLVNC
jgi:hypothetical protein